VSPARAATPRGYVSCLNQLHDLCHVGHLGGRDTSHKGTLFNGAIISLTHTLSVSRVTTISLQIHPV